MREPQSIELLLRAGFKCEYCHRSIVGHSWHEEHVIPKVEGGTDEAGNLAVACARCNLQKARHRTALDLVTDSVVPLFNPRLDSWEDHFRHHRHYVVGATSTGRATAVLLFRNSRRHMMVTPLPMGLNDPEVNDAERRQLVWLYAARKAQLIDVVIDGAMFADLERVLGSSAGRKLHSSMDWATIEFAMAGLEALVSRALPDDILRSISLGEILLRILPQQTAPNHIRTMREAYVANKLAVSWRQLGALLTISNAPGSSWCTTRSAHLLRTLQPSLKSRFRIHAAAGFPLPSEDEADSADTLWLDPDSPHLAEDDMAEFLALCDVVLRRHDPDARVDRINRTTEALLQVCGYGQDADLVHGVMIQRRWLVSSSVLSGGELPSSLQSAVNRWLDWRVLHQLRAFLVDLEAVGSVAAADAREYMLELPGVAVNVTEGMQILEDALRSVDKARGCADGWQ